MMVDPIMVLTIAQSALTLSQQIVKLVQALQDDGEPIELSDIDASLIEAGNKLKAAIERRKARDQAEG